MVRVVHHSLFWGWDANVREHLGGGSPSVFFGDVLVGAKNFRDLLADPMDGIERGHRLLKDDADLAAADFLNLGVAGLN